MLVFHSIYNIHYTLYVHSTMGTNPRKNDSENIKVIIGKLIEKADTSIRPVISAFDCFQSRSHNIQRLSQPTIKVGVLEQCAEFLGIKLADQDGFKIYNKASLVNRIYLGFMALMPAKCGECGDDYVIDHDPDIQPFFNCFRCFKGSHHCERNKLLHETLSAMNTPSGFVWLCDTCHGIVDPIEPRKQKSRHHSTSENVPADSQSEENSGDASKFSSSSLFSSTQAPITNLSSAADGAPHSSNVCQNFLSWSCPHGISGKKKVGGKTCPFTHLRVCNQYRSAGFTGKKGCKKGKSCSYFHPDICRSALEHGSCSRQECSKFHPRSTRKKTNTRQKSKTNDTNQRVKKQSNTSNTGTSDFLELRNLVTGMAIKLEALEKKINQSTPSQACPTVGPPVGAPMIYQPPHAMMSLGVPRLPHNQIPFSHPSYF